MPIILARDISFLKDKKAPLQLETRLGGQNHFDLVQGGVWGL